MTAMSEVCDHCGMDLGQHLIPNSRCPGQGRTTHFFMAAYQPTGELRAITCPQCGRTSHNPNDVREKYCGNCHQYHDTMLLKDLKGGRGGVLPPERPV